MNCFDTKDIYLCSKNSTKENDTAIHTVTTYETVVSQQDHVCGIIGAPTTIIQFHKTDSNRWDRIDSQVSGISLRTSCDILRRCVKNDEKYCAICDDLHANLFCGLSSQNTQDQLINSINANIDKIREYFEKEDHQINIDTKNARTFVYYECPMFGYRELVFPIFFEQKVIGTFILGQIKLEGNIKCIAKTKKAFFKKNPTIFKDYLSECEKLTKINSELKNNDITDFVITHSFRGVEPKFPEIYPKKTGMVIPFVPDVIIPKAYVKTIDEICKWLDDFEEVLKNDMKQKREMFVNRHLDNELVKFHNDLFKIDKIEKPFHSLQKHVNEFINRVVLLCDLQCLIIYSTKSIDVKNIDELDVLVIIGEEEALTDSSFLINNAQCFSPQNSKHNPDLFRHVKTKSNVALLGNVHTLIYHPMIEIPAASVAILVEYKSQYMKETIEDTLTTNLFGLMAFLCAKLSVMFENATQTRLENTLRLYKHEIVTLSKSIKKAVHTLGSSKLAEISKRKIIDTYNDASSSLDLFDFMSRNIGIILNNPIAVKKNNFDFYYKLLYKWENAYRMDAHNKKCELVYKKSKTNLNSDIRYTELIVYNLISNAIKYSYDRTKIYLHFTASEKKLTVTNFSFSISSEDRRNIFQLGYRGTNAEIYYPEGTGIGLWVIEYVLKLLGGSIKLIEPILISDYNVPLLHALIMKPGMYKHLFTEEEYTTAEAAYQQLKKCSVINDFGETVDILTWIVRTYGWKNPFRREVIENLNNPTYEIRFEVIF